MREGARGCRGARGLEGSWASDTRRGLQAPSAPRASGPEMGLSPRPSVPWLIPPFLFDSSTGIVASNTRDNDTGATYPHLNFSVPITVLQPALQWYRRTGGLGGLRELDGAAEPVRVVWRLRQPLMGAPRSKL